MGGIIQTDSIQMLAFNLLALDGVLNVVNKASLVTPAAKYVT